MSLPTLVLVHGAWHSGSCWLKVLPFLQEQSLTVIAPDLPGHGTNILPLGKVTFKAYVNEILKILESIEGKIVLAGHSMAGMVISEVAARRPDKIHKLVFLCAYMPRHNESLFDLIALNRSHEPFSAIELAMQMSDDKRSCSIADDDIIPLFYQLAPAQTAVIAKAGFSDQATLPLASRVNLETQSPAEIHRTYICCSKDKVIPVHHQRRMLNRQSCDTLLQLDADHSPFYSCPEQLAALLVACTQE